MNQAKNYLFVLLFAAIVGVSCDKKVVYPETAASIATTQPAIVYGSPDVSFNGIDYTNLWPATTYGITYTGNVLFVSLYYSWDGPGTGEYWYIQLHAKDTGTYLLSNKNIGYFENTVKNSSTFTSYIYCTDSIHTGKVTLTVLDTINHVASGTCSYAGEMQSPTVNGDVASIKNGFFTNLKW